MADKKISELTTITGAETVADDFFVVVDTSGSATKKISRDELTNAVGGPQTGAEIKSLYEAEADTNAFTDAEKSKLSGVEASATADQTGAEIKAAYEAEVNAFTDAQFTKLAGIETAATADQSDAEIKTAYENNSDTNAFTDAEKTKLAGIEANADVTDVTNVTAAGALMDSEVTNLAQVKSFDSADYATAAQGAAADAALPKAGGALTGAVTTNSTFDGRNVSVDGSKLDGIEAGATADQTAAEIRALVEAATDSNVFTDADYSKLNAIEASATADQTASELLTAVKTVDGSGSGLDADLLDGQQGSYYTGYTDTAVSNLVDSSPSALNTLNELAAALGDDANFSTTVTNSIATKLPLAGGTMTGNISFAAGQTFDGRDVSADGSKLDGIEAGATADQTGAEIKAAYEAEANAFTDAQFTKLAGIEASADVTDTANVTAAGALMDSEVTNLAQVKAFDSSDYATAAQGTTADAALPRTGGAMTGAITTNSTFDGRDVAVDGAKLDGIEAGATADQTAAEIRAAVEAATDSNVFTDADHTKLNGIATGATAYGDSDVDTHLNTSTAATNEVLSWTGTDYDWVAQSGGGGALELYAENPSSPTAPSATGTNAVAIGNGSTSSGSNSIAIGQSANAANGLALGKSATSNGSDATAIGPYARADANASTAIGASNSGQGAKTASGGGSVALGGSYASGVDSFAAAISTNSVAYGASGASSIAMGRLAKATGQDAIAIGDNTQATATNAIAFGNFGVASAIKSSVFGGDGNVASGGKSIAIGGYYAEAREECKIAFGGGYIGTGPATHAYQAGLLCMGADTTDATATILRSSNTAAGTTNQVILPNNSAFAFHGTIIARESAASGTDCAAWKVEGLIRREGSAGTTVLVNSATTVLDNTPSWGMALSADTTNGGLKIEVTGAAATNIRWVGTIHTSEVTYA